MGTGRLSVKLLGGVWVRGLSVIGAVSVRVPGLMLRPLSSVSPPTVPASAACESSLSRMKERLRLGLKASFSRPTGDGLRFWEVAGASRVTDLARAAREVLEARLSTAVVAGEGLELMVSTGIKGEDKVR